MIDAYNYFITQMRKWSYSFVHYLIPQVISLYHFPSMASKICMEYREH